MTLRNEINQGVILAGGLGSRLGLKYKPKPLAIISGKPIIEHVAGQLELAGVSNIIILTSFMSSKIENWASNYNGKAKLTVLRDDPPLGTAGALKKIERHLSSQFVVTYGDMIFNIDLKQIKKFHIDGGQDISLLCQPNDHPFESDLVLVGKKMRIQRLYRPKSSSEFISNLAASSVFVMKRNCINSLPAGIHLDLGRNIMNSEFCNNYIVRAFVSKDWINDIGTPGRLRTCRRVFKKMSKNVLKKDTKRNFVFKFLDKHDDPEAVVQFKQILRASHYTDCNILIKAECFGESEQFISRVDHKLAEDGLFFDEIIVRNKGQVRCRTMADGELDINVLNEIFQLDEYSQNLIREFIDDNQ